MSASIEYRRNEQLHSLIASAVKLLPSNGVKIEHAQPRAEIVLTRAGITIQIDNKTHSFALDEVVD